MTEISSNKTIAKNTLLLYLRTGLTLLISLYTSRVILATLGVDDNGIYNIVGGAVGMFTFLNGALAGATSRFLTFEIGRGDKDKLKQTFAAALIAHIVVAIVVLLLLETVGLWFLNHKLVIPADRMHAARVAYQFSAIATMFSITQVPFSAAIVAHEKMGTFAYMSILNVSLKLGICYLIVISPFDKLITYSALVLTVTIFIQCIYRIYCIKRFEECHLVIVTEKGIFKPMLAFSGWDMFGNFSSVARDQGVDIVLNMFFGPAVNSAGGFAGTIGNVVNSFSSNFLTAIRPSIVKTYSIGDIKRMESLMINASKYSFSLLILLSVPFFFESQFVLDIWLKTPPEHTAAFCSIDLGLSLLIAMFSPLVYAIHATGNIRVMSIVNGFIWVSVVPVTYFLLSLGLPPEVPYVVKYFLLVFIVVSNSHSVKKNIPEFDVHLFFKKAIIPSFLAVPIILAATYLVYIQFDSRSLWRFLAVCMTSTITTCLCVYFIVFDKYLRATVNRVVLNFINRFRNA